MRKLALGLLAGGLIVVGAGEARADISFSLDQQIVQGENLLFNEPGLTTTGTTINGIVQSGYIYDLSSDETLTTPAIGQARVEAVDQSLNLLYIRPQDSDVLFEDFEANLRIVSNSGGTANITACNQFGGFDPTAPFDPTGAVQNGGPCEEFSFDLGNGENFFVLTVSDAQLLSGVRIDVTGNSLLDVRQIRIGGSQDGQDVIQIPEPSTALLLGGGLLAAVARAYRRRKGTKVTA